MLRLSLALGLAGGSLLVLLAWRAPPPASASDGSAAARDGRAASVVPPQCYTRTVDAQGRVHNPCFTCHTKGREPNYVNDADLQTSYDFSPNDQTNPFTNLFVDRSALIARIPDDEILRWVRTSNYPPELPVGWTGYRPDAAFSFDELGFDHRADGTTTGWRAYAYTPLPGSFFPTNGSIDDALIRLPEEYRQRADGTPDLGTYLANLAVVQHVVRDRDARGRSWAGRAGVLQKEGRAPLVPGLFPIGTELLHSVRYLDIRAGRVGMAARMKELRYAKKTSWLTYADHLGKAHEEELEKKRNGARARVVEGDGRSVDNGRGWRYVGFIEDERGALRPQTHREAATCVGCHGGIGSNVDSAISFQRQLPETSFQRGWAHPTQSEHVPVAEPKLADGRGEYALYLAQNGAGDELRANDEVLQRFFDARGELRADAVARIRDDVAYLLLPSPERALRLDKAYLTIVREQSFELGTTPVVTPATEVHHALADGASTGIAAPLVVR